jgi:hypothetical protein
MDFESYPLQITLDLVHLLEWGGKDEAVILSPASAYAGVHVLGSSYPSFQGQRAGI